jgi:hypothetical protein
VAVGVLMAAIFAICVTIELRTEVPGAAVTA